MQHDRKYPRLEKTTVQKASFTWGAALAWLLIGMVAAVIASGLLALIVALWRVIL